MRHRITGLWRSTLPSFDLHDWNDARLVLLCVRHGGFSGAALAMGVDQATVSRRIAALEQAIGRPLFKRRRGGATPTAAGLLISEKGAAIEAEVGSLERTARGLGQLAKPCVSIAARSGLAYYLLTRGLLNAGPGPVLLGDIAEELPPLSFVPHEAPDADIAVVGLSPGEIPSGGGAAKVRRIGSMRFVPVAADRYLSKHPPPSSFDQLSDHKLLDLTVHRSQRGLDPWNELSEAKLAHPPLTVSSTEALHFPLLAGLGIALLPDYSPLFDPDVVIVDVKTPTMVSEIWLSAHEEALREPATRLVYNAIGAMFLKSPWFRDRTATAA